MISSEHAGEVIFVSCFCVAVFFLRAVLRGIWTLFHDPEVRTEVARLRELHQRRVAARRRLASRKSRML
jgi:hypothetical protein